MDVKVEVSAGLKDCLEQLCSNTYTSIRIIDALIATSIDDNSVRSLRQETTPIPEEVKPVLATMLQALGSSSYTILKLSNAPGLQTRDCFSIARSIVEVAVNICYIIAEGTPAAEHAQKHAQQKSFRDLERVSQIGNSMIHLAYSGRPDTATIEGLDEQIKEFTSREGREKGWVDASIDARINSAGAKLGQSVLHYLHFARFMIYRHSSEILHGTYFSVLFLFGVTSPSTKERNLQEAIEAIGQLHMMILHATIISLSAVIEAFHSVYGFEAAHKGSLDVLEALRKIPYFNREQSKQERE